MRELYQAAGLSTFFVDYPEEPEVPDLHSISGRERYGRMVVDRLEGFDRVTLHEIVRDCGCTPQQARRTLKRLVKEGQVLGDMDGTYVLVATLDAMLGAAGREREDMRKVVHAEDEAMGLRLVTNEEAA